MLVNFKGKSGVIYLEKTYLRSPSTSGRSLVMAITKAKRVTKHVIKATGELHREKMDHLYGNIHASAGNESERREEMNIR
jgi:hypothetical protein